MEWGKGEWREGEKYDDGEVWKVEEEEKVGMGRKTGKR